MKKTVEVEITDEPALVATRERQSEVEVIANLMANPEASLPLIARSGLSKEHFSDSAHGALYEACLNLGIKCSDPVLVRAELARLGTSSFVSESLLALIRDASPSHTFIADHATIVKNSFFRRKLSKLALGVHERAERGEHVLDLARTMRVGLSEVEKGGGQIIVEKFSDGLDELLDQIARRGEDGMVTINTGFVRLDSLLQGFKAGQFVVAGARPSMGKTCFGLQIAGHAACAQKKRVLFFSLEMPKALLQERALSAMTSIPHKSLIHNIAVDWDWVAQAQLRLQEAEFHVMDKPGITVDELASHAHMQAAKIGGLDLIVVDYLGLLRSPRVFDNKNVEVAYASQTLKNLARELNCAVLCLVQLNRMLELRPDKRPHMSDIRDSGSVEQDADVVMLLHRDDYFKPEGPNQGLMEIIVAKNRQGEIGNAVLEHQFHYQRFVNTDRRME